MARYTGADCKLCRREKTKLYLKGSKCDGPKCPIEIRHGHFTVNGRKVDIPSFLVTEADIVQVKQKSVEQTPFQVARAEVGDRPVPAWLAVSGDNMQIMVHSVPLRAQIDTQIQEQLI